MYLLLSSLGGIPIFYRYFVSQSLYTLLKFEILLRTMNYWNAVMSSFMYVFAAKAL
jgi:hypothetical protein